MDLKRIAEHLHIEMVEIGFVIYRNEIGRASCRERVSPRV